VAGGDKLGKENTIWLFFEMNAKRGAGQTEQ